MKPVIDTMEIEKSIYRKREEEGATYFELGKEFHMSTDKARSFYERYQRELYRMKSPLYRLCLKYSETLRIAARSFLALERSSLSITQIALLSDDEIMDLPGVGKVVYDIIIKIINDKNLPRKKDTEYTKNLEDLKKLCSKYIGHSSPEYINKILKILDNNFIRSIDDFRNTDLDQIYRNEPIMYEMKEDLDD